MLDLALPSHCLHCGQPTAIVSRRARTLEAYLCTVCHRILQTEEPVEQFEVRNTMHRTAPELEFEHCYSLYRFNAEAPIRSIIHAAKYEGMMRLAKILGQTLATVMTSDSFDLVIPVPLHRTRLAERGYNQSIEIARGLALDLLLPNAIKRTRPTVTQTSLHIEERIENVRGAFALTRRAKQIAGKRILIVDDVMTTGATIASVAETVRLAAPASISIATVSAAIEPQD